MTVRFKHRKHLTMFGLKRPFGRKPKTSRPQALDETPLPNSIAQVLDTFVSGDKKRRAEVWRRHDGFFGFSEEQELDDEYAGLSWSPVRGSGLYATRDEALRDARAEIPWIRPFLT